MPLMSGRSKKSIEKNIESEMSEGKPQALSIAYGIKRKNKKKMAKGGMVDESAKTEQRPMPKEQDKDAAMVSRNSSKKPMADSKWTDQPTVKQAQKPSRQPLKHPKMVPTNAFSIKLRDQEDDLMDSAAPAKMADGGIIGSHLGDYRTKNMHLSKQDHSAKAKHLRSQEGSPKFKKNMEDLAKFHEHESKGKYAGGGMINEEVSMEEAEQDHVQHPAHLEEDNDQMAPKAKDFMEEHDAAQFADGGEVEMAIDHAASIASAIMSKRRQSRQDSGSEDEDQAEMFADGGEVDLSINADEEPNHEDQYSFEALKKENYSESEGLEQMSSPMDSNEHGDSREMDSENDHDGRLVSAIRRKMKMRSPISR